jgi:hypothetical protein
MNNEDYLIEDILQRAFIQERLVDQAPKLAIDLDKMYASNKGFIDVEVYKKLFLKLRKKGSKRKK